MYDGCIYQAVSKIDKSAYIGSSSRYRERRSTHKSAAKGGAPGPFYDAIRLQGWDSFQWSVVKTGTWANRSALIAEEDAWQASQRAAGVVILNKQTSQHAAKAPAHRKAISDAKLGVATKHGYCKLTGPCWKFIWRKNGQTLSKSFSVRRYGYWEAKKRTYALRHATYPEWSPAPEEEACDQLMQIEW